MMRSVVCVCMYCMYVCIYKRLYARMYVCMYVFFCMYVCIVLKLYIYVFVYISLYNVCICTQISSYLIKCMYVCIYVCMYACAYRRISALRINSAQFLYICVLFIHTYIYMQRCRCCMSVCPYMPCPSACVSVSGGWYHPSGGVSLSLCVSVSDRMVGLLSSTPLCVVMWKWRRCSWTKEPTWRLRPR